VTKKCRLNFCTTWAIIKLHSFSFIYQKQIWFNNDLKSKKNACTEITAQKHSMSHKKEIPAMLGFARL
jgi:hypothetical protein